MDAETLATLLLQRLPRFGCRRYWQLMEHYGSAEKIVATPVEQLTGLLSPAAIKLLSSYQDKGKNSDIYRKCQQDIEYCQQYAISILHPLHPDYPPLLAQIHDAPMLLFIQGDPFCLQLPQIAVVGSRNASPAGIDHARQFSRELAASGITISSGLALGVDGAAHQGALSVASANSGKTVAVLGSGIDKLYPRQHGLLADHLLNEGGALVSEFPLGTMPQPHNFPRRNRIISGLSMGVLVVEAALRSGSLITARLALEQNREVFAIPGSVHNPVSRGCHQLIKQGAHLVESAEDIFEHLQGQLAYQQQRLEQEAISEPQEPGPALTAEQHSLLNQLGFEACDVNRLSERSGLDLAVLSGQLIELELMGLVDQHGGLYQRRR